MKAPVGRQQELNPRVVFTCDEGSVVLDARGTINRDGVISLTYFSTMRDEYGVFSCTIRELVGRQVSMTMGPNSETRKVKRWQPSFSGYTRADVQASVRLDRDVRG